MLRISGFGAAGCSPKSVTSGKLTRTGRLSTVGNARMRPSSLFVKSHRLGAAASFIHCAWASAEIPS